MIKTKKNHNKDSYRYKLRDFDNEMEFYFPPQIKTDLFLDFGVGDAEIDRSEEHTSELQSHSFISYAVFCLKKKKKTKKKTTKKQTKKKKKNKT